MNWLIKQYHRFMVAWHGFWLKRELNSARRDFKRIGIDMSPYSDDAILLSLSLYQGRLKLFCQKTGFSMEQAEKAREAYLDGRLTDLSQLLKIG